LTCITSVTTTGSPVNRELIGNITMLQQPIVTQTPTIIHSSNVCTQYNNRKTDLMVARCPEWSLELDVKAQSLWRPDNILRSTTARPVMERCFRLSNLIGDKMKCVGIKGRGVVFKCRAVEVSSWHVSQQTTHVVVEAINVNDSFWAVQHISYSSNTEPWRVPRCSRS